MPLGPGRVLRRGTARVVQAVDGAVELGRRWTAPAAVGINVLPTARHELGRRAEFGRKFRHRPTRRDRHQPGVGLEVEELVVDPGGRRRDPVVEAGAGENFAVEERSLLDGEVHRACAAGPERLQIDAVRQHDKVAAAQQFPVARLIDHGLAHREQHDRDPDAERVSTQQERAAP